MSFQLGNAHDARTLPILAKTIYRELRVNGFEERHVMVLAGELLSLVVNSLRTKRTG